MNPNYESLLLVCLGMVVIVSLIRCYRNGSHRLGLAIVLCWTFLLKCYCSSDHYLHEWDERYHALVAKNMIQHPLKPTLYETPVEPYRYTDWIANHVWLSKPPLPLWFMAASIATFGTHEYAVRLPGVIWSVLSVWLIYLIASKLYGKNTALLAAFLYGSHGMLTDLASGRLSSDGVETCFLFFVNLGMFWIFRKPQQSFSLRDYLITGCITGAALMSKFQPAFLIPIVAFVYHFDRKQLLRHVSYSTLSALVSCAMFAPWAIYCMIHYPQEARWMAGAIFHPMTMDIPGNDGTWYSYLTDFGNFFGYPTNVLLIYAMYQGIKKNNRLLLTLCCWILIPLLLFSFAEIKRGTYLMIAAPAAILLVAHFVVEGLNQIKSWKWTSILGYASAITILIYSTEKLYLFSKTKSRNREWSDTIKSKNPPPGSVIYGEPHPIEMMFYHDVTAYSREKKVTENLGE